MIHTWILDILLPWIITSGLKVLIIFVVAFVVVQVVSFALKNTIRRAVTRKGFASEVGEKRREDTLISLFTASLRIVAWVVVTIMVLSEVGLDIAPLLAGAGIIGVAFGFGAQYLVRDIINGVFIIFEDQFKIGDVICTSGVCGTVERVSLRVTTIRDLDGIVHHIPNGELKVVSNQTQTFSRINMDIDIGYASDIDHVEKVINNLGADLIEDSEWKDKIIEPIKFVRVNGFGDSAIQIKILGMVTPGDQWEVAGEVRRRLKKLFESEHISIPFPQQEVRVIGKQQDYIEGET